jgi:hypothetical protein
LFSCSLGLAAVLAPIERAFGGLDRVAVWHRRAAVAGVLLLIPHVALVSSAPDRVRDIARARARGHRADRSPRARGVGTGAEPHGGPMARTRSAAGARKLRAMVDRPSTDRPVCRDRGRPRRDRRPGSPPLGALAGGIPDRGRRRPDRLRAPGAPRALRGPDLRLHRGRRPPAHQDDARGYPYPRAQAAGVCARPVRVPRTRWLQWLAAHPFSVPSDPGLEPAIKASGDYTRDLYAELRPGRFAPSPVDIPRCGSIWSAQTPTVG